MIVGFVWLIVMANGHLIEATRTSIKYSCNYMCAVMHCMQILWLGVKLKLQLTVFIEMINFFEDCLEKARNFFVYGILPEIVGKWYTRIPVAESDGTVLTPAVDISDNSNNDVDDDDDNGRCWCYCCQPSFGDMIRCDNKQCSISWFHFDCLRIRTPPKGKWYCPSCRKLKKFKTEKK